MSDTCPKCPKSNRRLPSLQYLARILAPYCKLEKENCNPKGVNVLIYFVKSSLFLEENTIFLRIKNQI